ncbi:MAG: hypothetical protein AB4426_19720 [Xenococcaceae cyanobacterium]
MIENSAIEINSRAPIHCHKVHLKNQQTLNVLNQRIATITNSKGKRLASYFGFDSQAETQAFRDALIDCQLCSQATVQKSLILSTPWECVAWEVGTEILTVLLNHQDISPNLLHEYCQKLNKMSILPNQEIDPPRQNQNYNSKTVE